jgi:hypothetical protein
LAEKKDYDVIFWSFFFEDGNIYRVETSIYNAIEGAGKIMLLRDIFEEYFPLMPNFRV